MVFNLDHFEEKKLFPQPIIDFMRDHGNFPNSFEDFKVHSISLDVTTVFLIKCGYLYYFTYSTQDNENSVRWDLFHPAEVSALLDLFRGSDLSF